MDGRAAVVNRGSSLSPWNYCVSTNKPSLVGTEAAELNAATIQVS